MPNEIPTDLRSAAESVVLDWSAVRTYLAGHGLRLDNDPPPRQFAGGLANLNYLIHLDGNATVLRLLGSGVPADKAWDVYYARLRGQTERALARLKVLLERKVAVPTQPGVAG